MSGPKITFIGAGSVEFTRNLLGDILAFPELRRRRDRPPRHRRRAPRDRRPAVAQRIAEQLGARPDDRGLRSTAAPPSTAPTT